MYIEKDNKIALVNLFEGLQEVGERMKMLVNEKYSNNPSMCEHNIINSAVSLDGRGLL
jgi:hypothetical protein